MFDRLLLVACKRSDSVVGGTLSETRGDYKQRKDAESEPNVLHFKINLLYGQSDKKHTKKH